MPNQSTRTPCAKSNGGYIEGDVDERGVRSHPRITAFMAVTYGKPAPKSVIKVMIGIGRCRVSPDESRETGLLEAGGSVPKVRLDGRSLKTIDGVPQNAGSLLNWYCVSL